MIAKALKGKQVSVVLDDRTLPAAAKALVGYLKKCARPQRPG